MKSLSAPSTLVTTGRPSQPVYSPTPANEDDFDFGRYLEILAENKWLIAAVTALALLIGLAYTLLQKPIYEANILVQVEEVDAATKKSYLGDAGALFDVKTPASAEIEILRSRKVVGQAVDETRLDIDAQPRYIPLIGRWLARHSKRLSEPGLLGMGGYVSGTEKIDVTSFEVPRSLEAKPFKLIARDGGRYQLLSSDGSMPITGTVGTMLRANTAAGPLELMVKELSGKPGAEFRLARYSRVVTIEDLQSQLVLAERGRQSGVISASLQDDDPVKLAATLNAIGTEYVRQNLERKAAEAEKALGFLDQQLPIYKRQLEASEDIYNNFRNRKGTVAFDDEAKLILETSADRQTKLLEAQQRRRELETRFTANHPSVQALDAQIAALQSGIGDVQSRIRGLPAVQQEAVRMERDVTVNTALYQSLLNNALQLRLVKEGKLGNARLLDSAEVAEIPVRPQGRTVAIIALIIGLGSGLLAAFVRNAFVEQRINDSQDLEADLGLPVLSTIPLSEAQHAIGKPRASNATGVRLLAVEQPHDPAIESLRSLRTATQFAMLDAPNNRVMITSATPEVGKTFVTLNFAALLAAAGRRVLLIDADLRRGHIHKSLALPRHGGLSEVIAGTLTAQQAVHKQVVPNLDLLTTGKLPSNPSELLLSKSFADMLDKCSQLYDLVIIDSPPVLVAADTAAMAGQAGTVLLVARSNKSTLGDLRESTRRLSLGGNAATGILLNGLDGKRRGVGAYKQGRYRFRNYNYQSSPQEA